MRQCDLGYDHEEPEPVVVEDNSDKVAETTSDAAVEIARLEAERDIKVAKIAARQDDEEQVSELAAMRARLDVLEAALAPPEPEPMPEPEPVVVVSEPDAAAAPPEKETVRERKSQAKRGFF